MAKATIVAAVLAIAAATAAGAQAAQTTAPANTQAEQPITQPRDNLGNAVGTPAEDLNIRRTAIPPVLQRAVVNPYEMRGVDRCPGIAAEVNSLTLALGPDSDAPPPADTRSLNDKRGATAASVLRTGVEAVIPYRGVIRRVSGATAYEKKVQLAVEAGFERRGYLKGMALRMGCAPPASPAWFRPAAPRRGAARPVARKPAPVSPSR